jgi:hypothetical protein
VQAARDELGRVISSLMELEAKTYETRAKANVAAAQARHDAAVQALKDYPFTAAMAGEEVDPVKVRELAQAVREAAQALKEAQRAGSGLAALNERQADLKEVRKSAVLAVIEAEGQRMAEAAHYHGELAMRARAAVEGLMSWAYSARMPGVAERLREALATFRANTKEDPHRLQKDKLAFETRLARFHEGWREAATALATDPAAAGPDPLEVEQ